MEDHHSYFVFTASDDMEPAANHTADVKGFIADQLDNATATARGNLIVGEWSCALVDSALSDVPDQMAARQEFCQGQEQVYVNTSAGWHFWSELYHRIPSPLTSCVS